MEEEEIILPDDDGDDNDSVEQPEYSDKKPIPEHKIKKLRNLKYFRDWTDEQIQEWYRLRHGDDEAPPEEPPDLNRQVPDTSSVPTESVNFDSKEYKKKFNQYLAKYTKEFAVDMNETNDAESLRAYVRYTIQLERVDEIIMQEQSTGSPDHRTLKGLGDFQRSLQMNLNELQDKLGISRKQRKEKVHDDIPQYIQAIQQKAKEFWERKTVSVKCERCKIELARVWVNFADKTEQITYSGTCEHCNEKVNFVL